MEVILLIGIQGAGKSTFYHERFAATHLRINLDMLRTRHRERRLVETCLEIGQPFVVDNTNPTRAGRLTYLAAAKAAGARVVGYYFQSRVEDCARRNDRRPADRQVPFKAILGTAARLERPTRDEGFDERWYVRIDPGGGFVVEAWDDEV